MDIDTLMSELPPVVTSSHTSTTTSRLLHSGGHGDGDGDDKVFPVGPSMNSKKRTIALSVCASIWLLSFMLPLAMVWRQRRKLQRNSTKHEPYAETFEVPELRELYCRADD